MLGRKKISRFASASISSKQINFITNDHQEVNSINPLNWKLWPKEGKLLFIFFIFWYVFGLFILGSASWWVASQEMGDWSFYIKRQIIWFVPSSTVFFLIIRSNIL